MKTVIHYVRSLFLLELFKGMSVTGRYLFRKKFTLNYPEQKAPCLPASVVCMPSAGIRTVKNAASPVSFARLSVRQMPLPSRLRPGRRVATHHAV